MLLSKGLVLKKGIPKQVNFLFSFF